MSVEQNWAQKLCQDPSKYVLKCDGTKIIPENKWGFLGLRAVARFFARNIFRSGAYDLENVLNSIAQNCPDTITTLGNEQKTKLNDIIGIWKAKRIENLQKTNFFNKKPSENSASKIQKLETHFEAFANLAKSSQSGAMSPEVPAFSVEQAQAELAGKKDFHELDQTVVLAYGLHEKPFVEGAYAEPVKFAKNSTFQSNCKKAVKLYQQAVKVGHPVAMAFLGRMYYLGWGVNKDNNEAKKLSYATLDTEDLREPLTLLTDGALEMNVEDHKKVAAQTIKDLVAQDILKDEASSFFQEAQSLKLTDPKKVIIFLEKAAYLGHPEAMLELGKKCSLGAYVPLDLQKAEYWLEKASKTENWIVPLDPEKQASLVADATKQLGDCRELWAEFKKGQQFMT